MADDIIDLIERLKASASNISFF